MQDLLQIFVGGLAKGAIYALVAAGLMLQWRVTRAVNFAQGEFVMLPAFFMALAANLGLPVWAAILAGMAAAVLILGVLFKFMLVDPVSRHGAAPLAVATMALGLLFHEALKQVLGDERRTVLKLAMPDTFAVGGLTVQVEELLAIVVAGVVIVLLLTFLNDTRTGRAMQAVAHDATAARVIGIRVGRIVLYALVANALLVVIASLLIGLPGQARLANGTMLSLAAITALVLGGCRQLRGVICGALILGMIENLAAAFVAAQYQNAIMPLILGAALLVGLRWPMARSAERAL